MIKRIIDIGSPARLTMKNRRMVIDRDGFEPAAVPIEDLGVLILDHPAITPTLSLLAACAENNVAVLICDGKHMPGSVLLPLAGNSLHSRTIARQVEITESARKRMWRSIVQAKIRGQAMALRHATGNDQPLRAYAARVRSGDPDNIEAQAARVYWQRLFGPAFRRDTDAPGVNALLNYGYAVMRAAVARAVVGAGLHPSLGLHHRNQYNSFCLADDLIEPLRPAIDLRVRSLCKLLQQDEPEMTTENKRALLEILNYHFTINGQCLPLMAALHRYAASVRGAISGEEKRVEIPKL